MRGILSKNTGFFIFVLILCCPLFAFAESQIKCDINISDHRDTVTLRGEVPADYIGKIITIMVLKPTKTINDLSVNNNTFLDVVVYSNDYIVKEQGFYEFSFGISGASGEFTVCLGLQDGPELFNEKLSYYNLEYVTQVIATINNAKTQKNEQLMKATIESEYEKLCLKSPLYNLYKNNDLTTFYKLLVKAENVNSVSGLDKQINDIMATDLINSAIDAEAVKTLFTNNTKDFGLFDTTIFHTFSNEIDATTRGLICQKFVNDSGFENLEQIIKEFQVQTIRIAIKESKGWGQTKDAVISNVELLKLDLTEYNKLSDENAVFNLLEGRDYDSLEKVKIAFNDAVKSITSPESNVSSGGSGRNSDSSAPYQIYADTSKNIQSQHSAFYDLAGFDWAAESITRLYNYKIINGKAEGKFAPADEITREEFVKLIVLTLDVKADEGIAKFDDIYASEWYASYISIAVKAGIIIGLSENIFGVGQNISREDMAVIAYRALLYKDGKYNEKLEAINFIDSNSISDYAVEAIASMNKYELLKGFEDVSFAPKRASTRAEVAVFLDRLHSMMNK